LLHHLLAVLPSENDLFWALVSPPATESD